MNDFKIEKPTALPKAKSKHKFFEFFRQIFNRQKFLVKFHQIEIGKVQRLRQVCSLS